MASDTPARSSPSVVAYVVYNEGWGERELADTRRVGQNVKNQDPIRLVNTHGGHNCCQSLGNPGNGDMDDWHVYVGLVAGTHNLMVGKGLSASVYTEITDLEGELNGFLTYDRQVVKMDQNRVRAANQALIAASKALGSSGPVTLPVHTRRSSQVTTPGFTNRYLRHMNGLAYTEVVDAGSPTVLRQDATYTVRPGLAGTGCYSFESVNFPGQFLRHVDSRVRNSPDDGSALLRADATWCARTGLTGGGVSFESYNFRGSYLRHHGAEAWLSNGAGGPAYNSPASWLADVTWNVTGPWAP
ncbi:AbfB domain-containing protein [Polymorphospora sp. NPDC051019]|uniref:AbfB domain-containing protein n=1 Tax=Polymorphospora sp. NPDC051019 TaxID=3155725 RepID=UPI003419A4A2